jgi:hypothetical protein
LHQIRAEGSDPFLWAEGVPGVEMYRMMSVQYGTVSCNNGLSVNGARGSKMVAQALSTGKVTGASTRPLLMQTLPTLLKTLRNWTLRYWSIPCIVLTLHLQTILFGPLPLFF